MRKLSLVTALLLSACMVGPDYKAPSVELPQSWPAQPTAADQASMQLQQDWWKQFNDPKLSALEEEGLAANTDIALAAARVAEARAILHLNEAQLYPNLSAQAGAERTSLSPTTEEGATLNGKPYNEFSVAAVLDYEIDLWGKLRRADEAARAQLLGEQANRDAVRLAVASDIATGYFNLLALNAQEAVTHDTIKARQVAYNYDEKQFKAGSIDVLSFRRAEAELAIAEAALPTIAQARIEQQNALSLLLGRSPKAMVELPVTANQSIAALPIPPHLPADAPSTLLQRRPDVSAAEQQLIAANAEIGVASADYYPTLSLSALIGLASADLDRTLRGHSRAWDIGATGTMPILDFGRTAANVDAAKARTQQALVTYQQTVRSAFVDVLNALNRIQTAAARGKAEARNVRANEETTRVAGLRYNAGYATQLDLVDAQRQLFEAQLDSIDARRDELSSTVTLYKAMGGGWQAPAAK